MPSPNRTPQRSASSRGAGAGADAESKVRSDIGRYAIVPEWLLVSDVSAQAIRLFAVLAAKYADHNTGQAYPSRKRLRQDMGGVSLDTVDRAIEALQQLGALHVEKRTDPDGDQTSNLYTVVFVRPAAVALDLPTGGRTSAATPLSTSAAPVAAPVRPLYPDPRTQTHVEPEGTGAAERRADQDNAETRTKPLTPAQEVKLVTGAVVDRWLELRHHAFGETARFVDRQAIKGLKIAVGRALASGCTAADISEGLTRHGDDPKGNPWYADEWANLAQAEREEKMSSARKARDRREAERLRDVAAEANWVALESKHPGKTRAQILELETGGRGSIRHIAGAIATSDAVSA